uniref:Uncharacterized protein n=1 Tax=Glossina austeni TaxID=7395 RepID=A0A1A9VC02_GLOAU
MTLWRHSCRIHSNGSHQQFIFKTIRVRMASKKCLSFCLHAPPILAKSIRHEELRLNIFCTDHGCDGVGFSATQIPYKVEDYSKLQRISIRKRGNKSALLTRSLAFTAMINKFTCQHPCLLLERTGGHCRPT